MQNKYKVLVSLIFIIVTAFSASSIYAQSTTQPTPQPVGPSSPLLNYCPAIFEHIFPIICINDGSGNCLQ